jgi:hypothetical protein
LLRFVKNSTSFNFYASSNRMYFLILNVNWESIA